MCFVSCEKKRPPRLDAFESALNAETYQSQFYPFAYVIHNTRTDEVVLVRDHLGVQPLYYCYERVSNTFIFGDTIPDILDCMDATPNTLLLDSEVSTFFSEPSYYSDNTLYEGVYRVEPGHIMHGRANRPLSKKTFWALAREGESLYYQDRRTYLEHFSALMDESIRDATAGETQIAAEFSVGMDSTSIYLASVKQGFNPALFMHAATPGSPSEKSYNTDCEKAFLTYYPDAIIHRMMGNNFDPIPVFKSYSKWFAGPPAHIFEVFSHELHQAVSANGHKILLSGFGGDQGVSGHVPPRFLLPEIFREKAFRDAWQLLSHQPMRGRVHQYLKYAHPGLHQAISHAEDMKLAASNLFKPKAQRTVKCIYPYRRAYFKTLREAEWQFLQGRMNHEIRMRIECSSIVSKKMGFEYRYPLLHPNLLSFFLSLPASEKRHQGVGRYLMRQYLAQYLPASVFNNYQKKEGLNIVPAAIDGFKPQFFDGAFDAYFEDLPYPKLLKDKMDHRMMIKKIKALMLKAYLT